MVKIKYLIIALLAVGIGILARNYFFPSEEKKVKKQFNLLSEWVSKAPGETLLTMAQKMKSVDKLFNESCGLEVPVHSISGSFTREEITSYAAQGRLQFSELSLRFYDLVVAFPEEGISKVTLTARLTGKSNTGEQMDETYELESILKKIENRWLFSNFKVVEVLKK